MRAGRKQMTSGFSWLLTISACRNSEAGERVWGFAKGAVNASDAAWIAATGIVLLVFLVYRVKRDDDHF